MTLQSTTFAVAMKDFFGYRPGDGMKEFALELRELTGGDKAELKDLLEQAGYTFK